MKTEKREILISYEILDHKSDLIKKDMDLLDSAIRSASNAYAPYSLFRVGAAILLENGQIITGSNQENAAYPSGLCAERVAAFAAGSHFPAIKMIKIALAAINKELKTCSVTPCGACRQVLLEYEQKQKQSIKVIMTGNTESVLMFESVEDLLPVAFGSRQLPEKETHD